MKYVLSLFSLSILFFSLSGCGGGSTSEQGPSSKTELQTYLDANPELKVEEPEPEDEF